MSTLPTIAAAVGGLLLLACAVVLVAQKLRLFRPEKVTVQMQAISDPSLPAVESTGGATTPRLRETSVKAWASRVIELKTDVVTIGRSLDSDIVLAEDAVSAEHCRLERQGDLSFNLVDLGSTNRTWVNGHKVQTARLRHGDQIRVGHTTFVFEMPAARA